MVVANGLEPLGIFVLYIYLPLHMVSLLLFIRRRNDFPIVGRYPKLTIGLMTVTTPCLTWVGLQFLNPSWSLPCWLSWWAFAPVITSFMPVTIIRATMLLCSLEITSDLAKAERARATIRERYGHINSQRNAAAAASDDAIVGSSLLEHSSGGDHTNLAAPIGGGGSSIEPPWQPSVWTRHRHWMRGRHLFYVIGSIIGAHLISDLGTSHLLTSGTSPCFDDSLRRLRAIMQICHAVIMIPQCLWLVIVIIRLRCHQQQDGWGLLNEFRWLLLSFWSIPLMITVLRLTSHTLETESLILLAVATSCCINVWLSTVIWPLYLSYRHYYQMQQRHKVISNITRLAHLLDIPEAYNAFLAFASAEFNSEGVLFSRRVNEYRDMVNHHLTLLATHTDIETSTAAAAAVVSMATAMNNGPSKQPPSASSPAMTPRVLGLHGHGNNADHRPQLVLGLSASPSSQVRSLHTPTLSPAATPTHGVHRLLLAHHDSSNAVINNSSSSRQSAASPAPVARALASPSSAAAMGVGSVISTNSIQPMTMMTATTASSARDQAHQYLLQTLIEANSVYSFYIDRGAPNELNLSGVMRTQIRSTLDHILLRAATAGNHSIGHGHGSKSRSNNNAASSSTSDSKSINVMMTRRGVSISTGLTLNEVQSLELEARDIFNTAQQTIISELDAQCFSRFRMSPAFKQLITAGLHGDVTIDGQPIVSSIVSVTSAAAAAVASSRRTGRHQHHQDGNGNGSGGIALATPKTSAKKSRGTTKSNQVVPMDHHYHHNNNSSDGLVIIHELPPLPPPTVPVLVSPNGGNAASAIVSPGGGGGFMSAIGQQPSSMFMSASSGLAFGPMTQHDTSPHHTHVDGIGSSALQQHQHHHNSSGGGDGALLASEPASNNASRLVSVLSSSRSEDLGFGDRKMMTIPATVAAGGQHASSLSPPPPPSSLPLPLPHARSSSASPQPRHHHHHHERHSPNCNGNDDDHHSIVVSPHAHAHSPSPIPLSNPHGLFQEYMRADQ